MNFIYSFEQKNCIFVYEIIFNLWYTTKYFIFGVYFKVCSGLISYSIRCVQHEQVFFIVKFVKIKTHIWLFLELVYLFYVEIFFFLYKERKILMDFFPFYSNGKPKWIISNKIIIWWYSKIQFSTNPEAIEFKMWSLCLELSSLLLYFDFLFPQKVELFSLFTSNP